MRPYATASLDLGRMPAHGRRHTFALRSESSPDGWVSSGKRPSKRREPKPDPITGLIGPVVPDDDMPVSRYQRYDASEERHLAGVIRMGDLD